MEINVGVSSLGLGVRLATLLAFDPVTIGLGESFTYTLDRR
jgi:hypothetical protein